MNEDTLGAVLDEDYRAQQRNVIVKHLSGRTQLSIGQLVKLCEHPQHGEVVATITIDEILALKRAEEDVEEEDEEEVAAAPKKKKTAKKTATVVTKKSTAKAPAKKGPAKAPAKTKAVSKKSAKKTVLGASSSKAEKGEKADKGKPKPRLDYDKGMKEVLAALKAASEPVGRSAIEKATGFTGVQVRAFAKRLADAGKIKVLGDGGRSTKYAAA
jgi:hypothetical protein